MPALSGIGNWKSTDSPTQRIDPTRRRAEFITPIPKPRKRTGKGQVTLVFDEGRGLSTAEQEYDPRSIINEVRGHVESWRNLPAVKLRALAWP